MFKSLLLTTDYYRLPRISIYVNLPHFGGVNAEVIGRLGLGRLLSVLLHYFFGEYGVRIYFYSYVFVCELQKCTEVLDSLKLSEPHPLLIPLFIILFCCISLLTFRSIHSSLMSAESIVENFFPDSQTPE